METLNPTSEPSKRRFAKWLLPALVFCLFLVAFQLFQGVGDRDRPDGTERSAQPTHSVDRSVPARVAADGGSLAVPAVPSTGDPGIPEIHGAAGAEVLPRWLPLFPGAAQAEVEDHSLRSDGLTEGTVAFLVRSAPGEAIKWFGRQAGAHGMIRSEDDDHYVSADGQRAFRVSLGSGSGDYHRIVVDFRDQGEGCACPSCEDGGR